ncbi:MAG: tRNA uridine-5-carboxymethylaminomethyl(34) synthesis GTPase MnmE [Oscillospiraceae bacterium]|jgi:tRNA modification GTPase|nr:tRNA uridine-5-carboxymethylaminomethyl(34) synthesis GTPase MnmE [Oscillospiraceae bacterium]
MRTYQTADTIAAIATPPGSGGIAILRVSGSNAEAILRAIFRRPGGETAASSDWESHRLYYGYVYNRGETIDEAMAVLMRSPRSYTREDVAELHVHGGAETARRALEAALAQGARVAEPGEFTRRAFESGRIDLAQAEATMRLIGASGEAAARSALRALAGGPSRFVKDAQSRLIELLARLGAAIDFPDEIEESGVSREIAAHIALLRRSLERECDPRAGRVLDEGLDIAIVGAPNAGKSSLLNALLNEERAIVHASPGTTRDVLTARLDISGLRVNLSDTAGLRETSDPVEMIGVTRAKARMDRADLTLLVIDASEPFSVDIQCAAASLPVGRRAVILNKSDLPARINPQEIAALAPDAACLSVSAATGDGLERVRELIAKFARALPLESASLTGARHVEAARRAAASLAEAEACLLDSSMGGAAIDLATVDLNAALRALCEITGETADEAVIDAVFANFCVGK